AGWQVHRCKLRRTSGSKNPRSTWQGNLQKPSHARSNDQLRQDRYRTPWSLAHAQPQQAQQQMVYQSCPQWSAGQGIPFGGTAGRDAREAPRGGFLSCAGNAGNAGPVKLLYFNIPTSYRNSLRYKYPRYPRYPRLADGKIFRPFAAAPVRANNKP